jgi:hypothetical protein
MARHDSQLPRGESASVLARLAAAIHRILLEAFPRASRLMAKSASCRGRDVSSALLATDDTNRRPLLKRRKSKSLAATRAPAGRCENQDASMNRTENRRVSLDVERQLVR